MRIIEYPSIKWREGLHTVKLLPSISETVVELSIMLFSLIYKVFFLCVRVCVCVLCAYACVFYDIVSQTNFCATFFGIPQETLE